MTTYMVCIFAFAHIHIQNHWCHAHVTTVTYACKNHRNLYSAMVAIWGRATRTILLLYDIIQL